MPTYTTTSEKRIGSRPAFMILGRDAEGRHHIRDLITETVHIVHPDGGRERRLGVSDGDGTLDRYMDTIDREIGWDDRHYGDTFFGSTRSTAGAD